MPGCLHASLRPASLPVCPSARPPARTLLFDRQHAGGSVTLNRPEVLTALTLQMRDDLWALLDVLELDPGVRVVVFKGAGNAFCSGADLNDFGTAPSYVESRRGRAERDVWGRLAQLDKPLI